MSRRLGFNQLYQYQTNKYKNKFTEIDGIKFHSRAEAVRYSELKILEKIGEIKELKLQPKFLLQDSFVNKWTGKTERPIYYIADFQYITRTGVSVIEDKKGKKTADYKIKRKLFVFKYPQYQFIET